MAIIESTSGQGIIGNASKIELGFKTSILQVKSQSGKRVAQRRGPLLYTVKVEIGSCKLGSDRYYSIMEEILDLEYGANTLSFALDKETAPGLSVTSARGDWDRTQPSGFQYNNEDDPEKDQSGTPDVDRQLFLGSAVQGQRGQTVVLKGAFGGAYVSDLYPFDPALEVDTDDGRDTDSVSPDIIAKKHDYVQFDGSTKVYQVTEDATANRLGPISENCVTSAGVTVNAYSGFLTLRLNTPLVESPDPDVKLSGTLVDRGIRIGNEVRFNMNLAEKPSISYLPGDIVEFGSFMFEEVIE
jgi:hypothetical protein